MKDLEQCCVANPKHGRRTSSTSLLETRIGYLEQYAHDPVLGRHYAPFSCCSDDRIVTTFGTQQDRMGQWGVNQGITNAAFSDCWLVLAEFHANCDGREIR